MASLKEGGSELNERLCGQKTKRAAATTGMREMENRTTYDFTEPTRCMPRAGATKEVEAEKGGGIVGPFPMDSTKSLQPLL
jgi:hypothetical protein